MTPAAELSATAVEFLSAGTALECSDLSPKMAGPS